MLVIRFALRGLLLLLFFVGGLLGVSTFSNPPDLHDFESIDLYETSLTQTYPGDPGLLNDLSFKQVLSGDLENVTALSTHVYPNFLPTIRRYAWYPYRDSDRLIINPSWDTEITEVSLNGGPISPSATIELEAQDHGREFTLEATTADGSRTANYVILVMPHTFPPLKTRVSAAEDVAPGVITGMQAAPNNPNFARWRMLRLLLHVNGISGTLDFLKKTRKQIFDDFLAVDLSKTLDLEHREYLPWVNFVLDRYGTPLKYNNSAPRTIYLPFSSSEDKGLLPKKGFIYKQVVQDSEDNFAEAITRSFITRKEGRTTELPRHLNQFDDGHHIDVTPWETIQNLFYRIHPAGTELKNGDILDKNVTSTYFFELNRQGEVVWEWDSIDHFVPDQSITYLPKDRYSEWDYFHSNGIHFTPDYKNILVSSRHMRSVVNVEYASGDVNWVLADPATPLNQFTYIGDPLGGISTIHAAIMRDNELLVFDNGHYDTPEYREDTIIYGAPIQTRHTYTRVVAYELDTEEMTATYKREWTYPERLVRTAGYLMFVPRSDNKENLLISWGSAGAFTEHSPDNRRVLSTDVGGMTYRFYKVNIDHWME